MSLILKDPQASLDYEIDWGADYLETEEVIVDSSWTVEPDSADAPIILNSSFSDRTAVVSVSGGEGGNIYRLVNAILTLGGRTDRRSFTLRVDAR